MNRLVTLASSSLLATGLAVLPVSVFAQPSPAATSEMKPNVAPAVTSNPSVTQENKATTSIQHPEHATTATAKDTRIAAPKEMTSLTKPGHDTDHQASKDTVRHDESKLGAAHPSATPAGTVEKSKIHGAS